MCGTPLRLLSGLLVCLALCAPACDPVSAVSSAGAKSGDAGKNSRYSWMCLNLPWRMETDILRNWHSKESEEPPIAPDRVRDYTLYCALGSNFYRCYAVVRIDRAGNLIAAYQDPDTKQSFQRSFVLTPQQMRKLDECLRANHIGELAASYVDTKAEDGTQGGVTLIAAGKIRRTFLSNAWPDSVRPVFGLIHDDFLRFFAGQANGFAPSARTILQTDPEATLAVRGLVAGAGMSMQTPVKSSRK